MAKVTPKLSKRLKLTKIIQNFVQNDSKFWPKNMSKNVQNYLKWAKMIKLFKMTKDLSRMTLNHGRYYSKMGLNDKMNGQKQLNHNKQFRTHKMT